MDSGAGHPADRQPPWPADQVAGQDSLQGVEPLGLPDRPEVGGRLPREPEPDRNLEGPTPGCSGRGVDQAQGSGTHQERPRAFDWWHSGKGDHWKQCRGDRQEDQDRTVANLVEARGGRRREIPHHDAGGQDLPDQQEEKCRSEGPTACTKEEE